MDPAKAARRAEFDRIAVTEEAIADARRALARAQRVADEESRAKVRALAASADQLGRELQLRMDARPRR